MRGWFQFKLLVLVWISALSTPRSNRRQSLGLAAIFCNRTSEFTSRFVSFRGGCRDCMVILLMDTLCQYMFVGLGLKACIVLVVLILGLVIVEHNFFGSISIGR